MNSGDYYYNFRMYTLNKKKIYNFGQKASETKVDGEVQNYKKLRAKHIKEKTLFEDPNFPPNAKSITYLDAEKYKNTYGTVLSEIKWKRPFDAFKNPKFFVEGVSRFDNIQGRLGDCWVLAAMADLAMNKKIFPLVVPQDQSFDEDYCGIFHFRIWRFGKWIEVVIDDYLPFYGDTLLFGRSKSNNELWSALLEKAYAKLNGSYEAISAGLPTDSMVDFTGGLSLDYDMWKSKPDNLFEMMHKAFKAGALMACSIDPSTKPAPPGLFQAHAHSITNVKVIPQNDTQLVRIRNPWGDSSEWTGPWSDKSEEWNSISEEEKKKLGLIFDDDGEFWMSFNDFVTNFQRIEFVFLSPDDAADRPEKDKWAWTESNGKWVKKVTAGGAFSRSPDTYHLNPQYRITIEDQKDDEKCILIVSLMQKDIRTNRHLGAKNAFIGFKIYRVSDADKEPLMSDFFKDINSCCKIVGSSSPGFTNVRDQTNKFELNPGKYVIIPSIFDPDISGSYLIRVYANAKYVFEEHDKAPKIVNPKELAMEKAEQPETTAAYTQLKTHFVPLADRDQEINWIRLKQILDHTFESQKNFQGFSEDSCRALITMVDIDSSGWLGLEELRQLWSFVKIWVQTFSMYDKNGSGYLDSEKLLSALQTAGFHINKRLLVAILYRYSEMDKGVISLEQFISCATKLVCCIKAFKVKDRFRIGQASFNLQQAFAATMFS